MTIFTPMQLRKPILCCSMQILKWTCLKIARHPSYSFGWLLNVLQFPFSWMDDHFYQLSCNCYILSPIFKIYSVYFLHLSTFLSMSCLKTLGRVRVLVIYCVINFEHLNIWRNMLNFLIFRFLVLQCMKYHSHVKIVT